MQMPWSLMYHAQEAYLDLAKKTLAFFSAVTALHNADYIIKVDDDVYLRMDHVPHIVQQWRGLGAGAAMLSSHCAEFVHDES